MHVRGLAATSLLTTISAGIALFVFSHITTVAGLLALMLLGVFWILLPVLFLSAIAWTYIRDRSHLRGVVPKDVSHERTERASG
jgi:hypothetical protein